MELLLREVLNVIDTLNFKVMMRCLNFSLDYKEFHSRILVGSSDVGGAYSRAVIETLVETLKPICWSNCI